MKMQLAFIRHKLKFSPEFLVVWLEKREVSGRELWKGLGGTYSTFQKVLDFLLLRIQKDVYKEICIKERLK